jgi:hypothetical protein
LTIIPELNDKATGITIVATSLDRHLLSFPQVNVTKLEIACFIKKEPKLNWEASVFKLPNY